MGKKKGQEGIRLDVSWMISPVSTYAVLLQEKTMD